MRSMSTTEQIRSYTDEFGETVRVELVNPSSAVYDPDWCAVTLSESEFGGSYSIAEAVATLEHHQAPAEIIDWVRAAA